MDGLLSISLLILSMGILINLACIIRNPPKDKRKTNTNNKGIFAACFEQQNVVEKFDFFAHLFDIGN